MGGLITMSKLEIERIRILERVAKGELGQKTAAGLLDLTSRQVRRLVSVYRIKGETGIISKKRGKPSNHQLSSEITEKALKFIREKYEDFGPTLAHEKLMKVHGLEISASAVRCLMIEHCIWTPKYCKDPIIHQRRERRPRFGELIQIDGCIHAWFENRGEKCVLLLHIDDATGKIMLHFCPVECTWGYFKATEKYVNKYGLPLAYYCDMHSSFINRQLERDAKTQFQRAMLEIGIKIIYALSPQAKGRVERAFRTLQDRLVKEMRLRGISSIEAANAFAEEYAADFNKQFSVTPKEASNAHRTIDETIDLKKALSLQHTRTISRNLILQFKNKHYQITQYQRLAHRLRGEKVDIREDENGKVTIFFANEKLMYQIYDEQPAEVLKADEKSLNYEMEKWLKIKMKYMPPKNHSWRSFKINEQKGKIYSPV